MKKLTILVLPLDAVGHVNACAGIGKPFLDRGHRVIFLVDAAYRGKLDALGFEEHIFNNLSKNVQDDTNVGEKWAKTLLKMGVIGGAYTVEEKFRNVIEAFVLGDAALESIKLLDNFTKNAIDTFKPDLFIIDNILPPCIYYSGIPWINNLSATPLSQCFDESDNFPPTASGIASNSPRDGAWHQFKALNRIAKYSKKKNDFFEHEMGYPRYPNDAIIPYKDALLSVYAFPEEYNYPDMGKLDGWFNVEVFNKIFPKVPLNQLIPGDFIADDFDGKWTGMWIYLSMGSMGSIDLKLMERLLAVLGTTNHKVVVSKGPRHQEYELPRNAWGERYLHQTGLLPHMNLVITHGGNNTVTETFSRGKPMLVMPLFGDQYDNAQRMHETGWAERLDPYEFTEQQLVDSIHRLMENKVLDENLKKASTRLLSEDRHQQLVEKVEQLLRHTRFPITDRRDNRHNPRLLLRSIQTAVECSQQYVCTAWQTKAN